MTAFLLFKTGTLTEGDLDLAGVCESRDGQFQAEFLRVFVELYKIPSFSAMIVQLIKIFR